MILRIGLGLIFVISGAEKIIAPYQNFLYVIQNYALFPDKDVGIFYSLEVLAARFIPWVEFFCGIFLSLGLWTAWALKGIFFLLLAFISVVGQAIFRGLPITECGCFGDLAALPLPVVLIFDVSLILLVMWLRRRLARTQQLGIDNYFKKCSG